MAKVNKSMLLNEGLIRLIDSIQQKTGVSFTRVMTASVLQYLFHDTYGPERRWMEAAVAVERGEINVGEAGKWLAQRHLKELEQQRQLAKEDAEIGCPASPEEIKELGEGMSIATNEIIGWEKILSLADDPIDAVLTFWKRVESGTQPYEITNAIPESLDKFKMKPGEDVQPSN